MPSSTPQLSVESYLDFIPSSLYLTGGQFSPPGCLLYCYFSIYCTFYPDDPRCHSGWFVARSKILSQPGNRQAEGSTGITSIWTVSVNFQIKRWLDDFIIWLLLATYLLIMHFANCVLGLGSSCIADLLLPRSRIWITDNVWKLQQIQ